jgi:23S rRNA pseudouridine1911/1915/1917 synthase
MNWVHSARYDQDFAPAFETTGRKTYVRKTMTDTASGGADSSAAAIHQVTIDAETAGKRLDQALAAALPALSRSRLKGLIEAGEVSVKATADEARRTISEPSMQVKSGQVLIVCVPAAADPVPKGQAIPLNVVYEDEALIVVDKPAGLVVHPAAGNPDRTLVNALIAHCGESLSGIGGVRRPGIVHRLDKDTSGLIVAAKTDSAHAALAAQFAEHSIERAYTALVWGVPRPGKGRIEGNIGRDPRNRKRMSVLVNKGKPAVTHYRVIQRFGSAASLIECRLETGRTHQIRVHLSHIGHPVIGDPVYGRITPKRLASLPEEARDALKKMGRQALHAHLIGFEHPCSKKRVKFESKLPMDINALLICLEGL